MSGCIALALYALAAACLGRLAHDIIHPVTRDGYPWPWRIRWLLWIAAPIICAATPFICIVMVLVAMVAPRHSGIAPLGHSGHHGR